MPAGFESGLGAISSAFGLDKVHIKPIYVDKNLQTQQDALTNSLAALRGSNASDLSNYETAFAGNTANANKYNADDLANLTALIKNQGSYDPTANYERIRSGNLSALGDWAKNLGDYGASADKLAMAARGYGGRAGDGGYGSILRTDRVSRNIAPVINTIFGNLGNDATSTSGDRLKNLAANLQLMQARQGAVDQPANRLLQPITARTNNLNQEIASLAGMIQNAKSNTAGYQSQTSNWDRMLHGLGQSLDQGADTYMSMYGMGGGAGGGGIGGMFGAGGGGGGGGTAGGGFAGNSVAMGGPGTGGGNLNAMLAQYSQLYPQAYQPSYQAAAFPQAYGQTYPGSPGTVGGFDSPSFMNYSNNPASYAPIAPGGFGY